MQRLRSWIALASVLALVATSASAQVVRFDDTFSDDPLLNGWIFNGNSLWVPPPGEAPDCHDGFNNPNSPDLMNPCSLYTEDQLDVLGETVEDFGGYILATPGENGRGGNAFRSERDMYDNFQLTVEVELRDGSIGRPADGMVVVIVGGDGPPNRTGTGGGGMGAPCVGVQDRLPMLAFEFDDWSCNTGDFNDENHVAFSYSNDGFPCTDAIPPQVFVRIDAGVAPLHNRQPPPADPNRYKMTVFVQRCGAGATVACNLEAIDRGIDFGRVYTQVIPTFIPFEGYLGVTASTGDANQNHILHSAKLVTLPAGFCLQPAAGAVRSISSPRSMVNNCGDFLAGDELTVNLTLTNVRVLNECCSAAGAITVRDTPPAGWTVVPGSITAGGSVMGSEVVWVVGAPSEGQVLSYRVTAADSLDTVVSWGTGSTVENIGGSASVFTSGQSSVKKDVAFDVCGGITCWSLLGAIGQNGGAAPGEDVMRLDYATDGVVPVDVFNFAPGEEITPDFRCAAAGTGIFADPNGRNPNRAAGRLTVIPWNDTDAFINLNTDVYGGDPNNVMAYAAVRVVSEEEISDVFLGVSSDDAVRVLLNGQEVHINNIARAGADVCTPQDVTMGPVVLEQGVNDLRVATYEGGGEFNFAIRFQDGLGTPVTEGLSISKTADIGCRVPPVHTTRDIMTPSTVKIGPNDTPAWSEEGAVFTVSLAVANVRTAAGSCPAAGAVTIVETVPAGWTPSMASAGGMVVGQEVRWTLASPSASTLTYRVTTGGVADNVRFGGAVTEAGSPYTFGVAGDCIVAYKPEAFGRMAGDVVVNDNFDDYEEFACPDGFTCNATGGSPLNPFLAGVTAEAGHEGRVRLADQNGNISSSVIYNEPIDLSASSFVAEFDIFFNHLTPTAVPADGLTFCVLNADNPLTSPLSLGGAGGGIGYAGLDGFAVELDLWDNGPGPSGYNNVQSPFGHVGLVRDGIIVPHVQHHLDVNPNLRPTSLGGSGFPFFMDFAGTGVPLHVEVDHNNGCIQVFLSAPATNAGAEPAFARTKVIDTVILFPASGGAGPSAGLEPIQNVYLGFTAGTGGAFANHEVDNLLVTVYPDERPPAGPFLVRGDADSNSRIELTDAIRILNFLFTGVGSPPVCFDASDTDDNGRLELTDAVRVLNYLFTGTGAPPAVPRPSAALYLPADCGLDTTPDTVPGGDLGCGTESATCASI